MMKTMMKTTMKTSWNRNREHVVELQEGLVQDLKAPLDGGAEQDDRKQTSRDRKEEREEREQSDYRVVMSLRARSSSSLRALPFSF
ncbi:hypothetical protein EYF80_044743 [Liparis tanakae]|uniref:Uncharacterized protein n=1 Tax=Liparis tanakae TaxID=230148 RepID=A0A4Z2FUU3_9TELE|nr:hypothetical protein EYF80_044743 [Liparis tanakae]